MTDTTNLNLAIAAQQLRAELTFKKIKEILAEKNIDVILLKGPHLGNTIYNNPRERLYCDMDVLVRPVDFEKAAALLLENGFKPFAFDKFAPEIQRDFKHWEFRSPWGIVVELHRWLSGHDRYPVDSAGLFERAEKFAFGETAAMGLGAEDLLLHLCLHMGASFFIVIEPKHVLDIALLTQKRQLHWDVFVERCSQFRLATIVYYSLLAANEQHHAKIPKTVLERLRPGWLRRCWLDRYLRPGTFPIYRFPKQRLTQIKIRLLLPLIDRFSDWPRYLLRLGRVYGKSFWQNRAFRK
ncbi:MAG: nucleotidyltransferase family protein [Candidatus Aminicenantes bacterium]|nr:nucleotidyltransferase family protein [Candidatus Aminicenantes bacterium]